MTATPRLNPDLEKSILAAIRAGGFADVAAAAFGVAPAVFRKWLRWGRLRKNVKYASFARKVAQAEATARLNAEMKALEKDPRIWLRAGPGRETAERQGWTTFARPQTRARQEIDPFAAPAFLMFLARLRAALAPFPDALAAAVAVLDAAERTGKRST